MKQDHQVNQRWISSIDRSKSIKFRNPNNKKVINDPEHS